MDTFTKVASQYLNIVNDLVSGGSTSLLSAEQGMILQNQIKNINILLASDNANLDTLQKIIDAIETIQDSLSSILINDLTTGGTTNVLTAEMGKTLKSLIDDLRITVTSKEDVSNKSTNIVSDSSNSIKYPSVKAVFDWVLSNFRLKGQNITYVSGTEYTLQLADINETIMFSSVLPVTFTIPPQANVSFLTGHTVKYIQTGEGSVTVAGAGINFTSNQSLTTMKGETRTLTKLSKDVWSVEGQVSFEKDLNLRNYRSTRNDGQLPTNKILSTDENGNLKMYTITTNPAPYIDKLIPDSYFPDTTGNIRILGDFFTPSMCDRVNNPNAIILEGMSMIHYATFKSSQEILVNVTTGSIEGSFSATLNNGLSSTKSNALLIILGTVFKPRESEFKITGQIDISKTGEIIPTVYDSLGTALWSRNIDYTKNFRIEFYMRRSSLGVVNQYPYEKNIFSLVSNSDYSKIITFSPYIDPDKFRFGLGVQSGDNNTESYFYYNDSSVSIEEAYAFLESTKVSLRWVNGVMYIYLNNILKGTRSETITGIGKIRINVSKMQYTDIKYIETI